MIQTGHPEPRLKFWRPLQIAVGETVTLLHPPPPLAGVSMRTERGCQQNDSLADELA